MTHALRRTLTTVVAALLLGMLAACSPPEENDASADPAYAPVTIEQQNAPVTINARPVRVITLLDNWTSTLAALDIPITAEFVQEGYAGPGNTFAWTPKHESDVVVGRAETLPSVDQLARFDPDIIFAGRIDDATFADYSGLAPTVTVTAADAPVDSWQDLARTVGKIFGVAERAEQLVTSTQARIDAFKTRHPDAAGKTFTFAQFQTTGGIGAVNSTKDPAAGLLAELGFTLNPRLAAEHHGAQTRSPISSERVDLLDSDLLLAWALGDTSIYARIPGWQSLTAVKNGTVVQLDNDTSPAFGIPSAPSVAYAIDMLDPVVAKL